MAATDLTKSIARGRRRCERRQQWRRLIIRIPFAVEPSIPIDIEAHRRRPAVIDRLAGVEPDATGMRCHMVWHRWPRATEKQPIITGNVLIDIEKRAEKEAQNQDDERKDRPAPEARGDIENCPYQEWQAKYYDYPSEDDASGDFR